MVDFVAPDYDVAIIGGGPGGSATASYLSRAGIKCIVLEKEKFPRPHVGESLVPSTTVVFRELGFLHKMEEAGFVHKHGAAWTTETSPSAYGVTFEGVAQASAVDLRFAEREQAGVFQEYTYHVDRAKFDKLLLEHAEELGATVVQEAAVNHIDFDHARYVEVGYKHQGTDRKLTARMVVDASGRRTFLGRRLGLKVNDPVFDQYALHTWFEGLDRGSSDKSEFIYIHFLPVTNTWVWQIPITETVTSIGVVTQKANFAKASGDRDAFFWENLKTRPDLYENLRKAKQLRPLTAEGDYSYGMKQICGDRYVLVGDAARFVDPIFSSGVSIALSSARLASLDIVKAVEQNRFDRSRFSDFETTMRRGCANWYNFISMYYRLNVLFTYFVANPKYRLDVLRLLQGDVYDEEEPPVLSKMRELVTQVEGNPNHVWHNLLGSLTADAAKPTF